jgi:membrane protein implicated in regulation of membrane protease activity
MGPRAYAVREVAELALILAGLGIVEHFATVPWWIWVGLPIGKAIVSIGFYSVFLGHHLRRAPRHGPGALVGRRARVLTSLDPVGQVSISGEIWTARSSSHARVPPGSEVRIRAVAGLTLVVERPETSRNASSPT